MWQVALTNIPAIPPAARAAGALWINCEGTLAATQKGWMAVAFMRALKLLGRRDPDARKAFALLLAFASIFTALLNSVLLAPPGAAALSRLMSNDADVRRWFHGLVWLLAVHTQTRIVDLTCGALLIPLDYPRTRIGIAFASFWLVATPVALVGCLTDAFSSSLRAKLVLCMACTSIGQALNAASFVTFLLRLDWQVAAAAITSRANTDQPSRERAESCSSAPLDLGGEGDEARGASTSCECEPHPQRSIQQ